MGDNVLSIMQVHKSFGDRVILDGTTLGIDLGERVGLIGDNGTGKSTLIKLLAGLDTPDTGTIALRTGLRIGWLPQVPTFGPTETARSVLNSAFEPVRRAIAAWERAASAADPRTEALLHDVERLGGWDPEHRLTRAASELRLEALLDAPITQLSGGEQKRVALGRLWLERPDLLLLDEPTNHLDLETVEWVEQWLGERGAGGEAFTAIVVTHDRWFLEAVVTRMIELRGGQLRSYPGAYSDYLVARAAEEDLADRTRDRRRRLYELELDWARKSPAARTTKQQARLDRVSSLEAELGAAPVGPKRMEELSVQDGPRLGNTILEFRDVQKGYGERTLLAGLTLRLRRGERFGILGPNGAGKSTLLKLATGEVLPDAGAVVLGKNTVAGYFDQHRSELDPLRSVRDTVQPDGSDTVYPGGERVHIASWLARFGFGGDVHRQPVSALSGGERNRLALARFLLSPANVLLLDEPTNDLDVFTLALLEEALIGFSGCVLAVSHDRAFLDKVATGIVAFEPDRVVVVQGNYTTYRRLRATPERRPEAPAQKLAPVVESAPRKKKLTWAEEKELAGMEAAVEAADAEVAQLESALADPGVWRQRDDALAKQRALEEAKARSAALWVRWDELLAR